MGARILWAVVAGFLIGVFVRSFVPIGLAFAGFSALLGTAMLLLSFVNRPSAQGGSASGRKFLVVAIALIAFAAGTLRMHTATLSGDQELTARLDSEIVLEGVVFAEPDARENSTRLFLRADTLIVGSTTTSVHAGVLVVAPPHAGIAYGDRMRAEGTLALPESFDTGLGREFDYPLYLAKEGITYELSFASVERTGKNEGNILKGAAIWVKQKYLEGLRASLPEPESGLAGGITVGDKRGPGQELSDTFRTVGLIHIVVLSGYNITVVLNALAQIFLRAPRTVQFGASGFVVLFFILMSGGAASAVRAGLMALVAVFARATGRAYLAGRILGVVALGMVAWDPFTLAFDPGFQLSVLATAGLIVFTPIFAERLQWISRRFGLREIAASTVSAQLAVLPLLLYQNGQLSLVALPANLLALAAIPPAMLASFIAALAGIFTGPFAIFIGLPAYALLAYVIGVANTLAALPFASVGVSAFSAWWLLPIYGLLFGGVLLLSSRYGRT